MGSAKLAQRAAERDSENKTQTVEGENGQTTLAANLVDHAKLMESTPEDDFTSALVKGFAASCADGDVVRMW
jgi:hypothetical protein